MYLDLGSDFFFIVIPLFELNLVVLPSLSCKIFLVLLTNKRKISPLILYLYLKPLYSVRGGSTTRDDPFIKNPCLVDFL